MCHSPSVEEPSRNLATDFAQTHAQNEPLSSCVSTEASHYSTRADQLANLKQTRSLRSGRQMTKILLMSRNLQNILPHTGWFDSEDNSWIMASESLNLQRERSTGIWVMSPTTKPHFSSTTLANGRRTLVGLRLVARLRVCRSNCKSLRHLRCSSHCGRRCARDGRYNAQLNQTRGTQVTNLPARHSGRSAACHQTRVMTPMGCSLPVPRGAPPHLTRDTRILHDRNAGTCV